MGKLLELLTHPTELWPTLQMYAAAKRAAKLPKDPDSAFCYGILNAVSRSFGVVITQLPMELKDAVCVFYLVLRALDTVEDDMRVPTDVKVPILQNFHRHILDPEFTLDYGDGEYRKLLNEFPKLHRVLQSLSELHRDVIADITDRMGHGMAKFIHKDVISVDDYDEYCYYVAGLVGVGLSKLFAASGLESEQLRKQEQLSIDMGLLLQKVNIMRDYLEDIMEEPAPRMFWPKEIWGLYAKELEDFKDPKNRRAAKRCLNHLILDLLRHVKGAFEYMEMIKTPSNFSFCAIPQVMAISTAALCFDNGGVFEGVVKLRRGETCKMFQGTKSMVDVYTLFDQKLKTIAWKLPNAEMESKMKEKVEDVIKDARAFIERKQTTLKTSTSAMPVTWVVFFLLLALIVYYWLNVGQQ